MSPNLNSPNLQTETTSIPLLQFVFSYIRDMFRFIRGYFSLTGAILLVATFVECFGPIISYNSRKGQVSLEEFLGFTEILGFSGVHYLESLYVKNLPYSVVKSITLPSLILKSLTVDMTQRFLAFSHLAIVAVLVFFIIPTLLFPVILLFIRLPFELLVSLLTLRTRILLQPQIE